MSEKFMLSEAKHLRWRSDVHCYVRDSIAAPPETLRCAQGELQKAI